MEIGVKYYSHNKLSKEDFEYADFVEVLPVPGNPLGVFEGIRYRYRIHCAHDAFGFNPSDTKIKARNRAIINDAAMAADTLKADIIVVHAGFNTPALKIKNPKKAAMDFLLENFDRRMAIENLLPVDKDMTWVAYSTEEMAEFKDAGFKLCMDFGHAVATAAHFKKDYKSYVDELAALKPDYFHLSGPKNGQDLHLSIFDTDTDLNFFLRVIKKHNKPVCLETPVDTAQRKKEVNYLKAL